MDDVLHNIEAMQVTMVFVAECSECKMIIVTLLGTGS